MKRNVKQRFLEKFDFVCAFCGERNATEVDHPPNRAIFPQRNRPAGLEMPICSECNHNSADIENAITTIVTHKCIERPEKRAMGQANFIAKHSPQLYAELVQPFSLFDANNQQMEFVGPITRKCLELFFFKIGFAYYHHLTNRTLTTQGGIKQSFYTQDGNIPRELVKEFSEKKYITLKQGKNHAGDVFWIRETPTDTSGAVGLQISLYDTYFCFLLIVEDRELLQNWREERLATLGLFKFPIIVP